MCAFVKHADSMGQLSENSDTLLSKTRDVGAITHTHADMHITASCSTACCEITWFSSLEKDISPEVRHNVCMLYNFDNWVI